MIEVGSKVRFKWRGEYQYGLVVNIKDNTYVRVVHVDDRSLELAYYVGVFDEFKEMPKEVTYLVLDKVHNTNNETAVSYDEALLVADSLNLQHPRFVIVEAD